MEITERMLVLNFNWTKMNMVEYKHDRLTNSNSFLLFEEEMS